MSSEVINYLYHEVVPAGKLVKGIVAGVMLLLIGLFVPIILGERDDLGPALGKLMVMFLLLAVTYWNFKKIEIWVTPQEFIAKYGLFSKRIPLTNILATEVTTASFGRYGGVGIRLGWDGSWAYTASFGPALRLRLHQGRPFVVSTHQSQSLGQALKRAMGR